MLCFSDKRNLLSRLTNISSNAPSGLSGSQWLRIADSIQHTHKFFHLKSCLSNILLPYIVYFIIQPIGKLLYLCDVVKDRILSTFLISQPPEVKCHFCFIKVGWPNPEWANMTAPNIWKSIPILLTFLPIQGKLIKPHGTHERDVG